MKNTTHIISILILLLWTLSSCDKKSVEPDDSIYIGDSTRVEGQVLEYGTLKPLPHTMIIIEEGENSGFGGSTSWYPYDTIYSDANGYYSYRFKQESGIQSGGNTTSFSYQMVVIKEKYFKPAGILIAKKYYIKNKNIILDPFAWIKVHVKNVNPFDEMDYLFTSSNGGGGHYYGKAIDSTELHIGRGNRKVRLYWTIMKNKIETVHFDSLYLPAHDTVPYEILY
jgi:hypothetical protein